MTGIDQFDFDAIHSRMGTGSAKWDHALQQIPVQTAKQYAPIAADIADMEFQCAPAIREAVMKVAQHGIFGYASLPETFQEAVSCWFARRYDCKLDIHEIGLSAGTIPAFSSIIRSLSSPGDGVMLCTPVYGIFFNCIRNSGRRCVEVPLHWSAATDGCSESESAGRWIMDFAAMEDILQRDRISVFVLCSPHNPTGTIWDAQELRQLLELMGKYNVAVLSDEAHADISAPGKRYTPLAAVAGPRDWAVSINSPSKPFNMAGLQISAVVSRNRSLLERVLAGINRDEAGEQNIFALPALLAAYSPEGERWLDAMRSYVWQNRQLVADHLRGSGAELLLADATYLGWIDIRKVLEVRAGGISAADINGDGGIEGVDASGSALPKSQSSMIQLTDEFVAHIRDHYALTLSSGTSFGLAGAGFIRINLAMPASMVDEACKRLVAASQ